VRPFAQRALPHELGDHLRRRLAEDLEVVGSQRQLLRRGTQLRPEHVRVFRVEDRSLHRAPEDRCRMSHQVGVQRVVPRDQQRHRVPTGPACASSLLPERRARTWPAREQYGVQPGNVDAQLESVRCRDSRELTALQHALEPPAFLR
jgi:hypothetical protein